MSPNGLASFELKRLSAKLKRQVQTLLEGGFVDRCENVLAFGNPGSGKTHLLAAIAHEMIQQRRRVYYQPCSLLVQAADFELGPQQLQLQPHLRFIR